MHSNNSPFKIMSSCAYKHHENQHPQHSNVIGHGRTVLGELSQQGIAVREPHHRSSCQWQQMVGHFKPRDGRTSPMVHLVDQAVSPIPPSKLVPRASIAIQASLVKDISPLKPLVFLHQRIPSPWKPPAASPSRIPPAPPSTPELPNEVAMAVAPFQSQGTRMFPRSVSPYHGSQSCGSSPVAPFTGASLFFPPSPKTLPQGNLLYGVNQIPQPTMTSPLPNHQSNFCPLSINPSPTPVESGINHTPNLMIPRSQIPILNTNVGIPPHLFTQPTSATPVSEISSFTPCQLQQVPTGKRPCMLMNSGLEATPSNIDTTANENVARKLCLASDNA